MHCIAPRLLLLPLPTVSRHALSPTQTPPLPPLLPSRACKFHLASARSPSRAAASVSGDDEDEEVDVDDDEDDETTIRNVDDEYDDDFEDGDEGDEGDEEAVDEESGGEYEEEAGEDEDKREDTAARRRDSEEYKSRRVAKLVAEVREFGEDVIDYNELAGIYDFPIDKFQVSFWFLTRWASPDSIC
jgi:hypothetical protein